MNRNQACQILTKYLQNPNLIKHCLAAEAAMEAICKKLNQDATDEEIEKWGIVGLLHDVDYEIAMQSNQPDKHGLLIFDKEHGIPEDIVYAIKAHNPANGTVAKSQLDWAIYCADQLTGLVIAAALVHPEKKLAPLTSEFILKRMKEKSFAKRAMREPILLCEEKLNTPLAEFVAITLRSMQGISNELGL